MRRRPHLLVLVSFRGWIALASCDPRLRPVPVPVYASRSSFSFRPASTGLLASPGSRQHSGWGGRLNLPTQFFRSGLLLMFSYCRACSVWRDFHPLRCSASLVAHRIWMLPPGVVVPNAKSETRNPKQIQMPNGTRFKTASSVVVLVIPCLVLGVCFGLRVSDFGFPRSGWQ